MAFETWTAFVLIWFVLVAFPGPNTVFVMAVSSRRGLPAALSAASGISLAVAVYVILVGLGLLAFMAASALAFEMLRWTGVGYLLYLGWKAWHAPAEPADDTPVTLPEAGNLVIRGALVSLTNPKSVLSYMLVYPPFLSGVGDTVSSLVIMGATSIMVALVVYTAYGYAASRLGRLIRSRRQALIRNRLFAAVFTAGGIALAVSERR